MTRPTRALAIAFAASIAATAGPASARASCSAEANAGEATLCAIVDVARVVSLVVPEYSLLQRGGTTDHGVQWALPIQLGVGGRHAVEASLTIYPGRDEWWGRAEYRRLLGSAALAFGLPDVRWWHLSAGIGGFVAPDAAGPRAAVRLLHGDPVVGGLYVEAAYEPDLRHGEQGGEVAAGLVLPLGR
jgi:hypothetical protein